jgi:hypothetical protein
MRLHNLLMLVIAMGALLPATVFAATSDYVCFESTLDTHTEADGFHVQITLSWWDWANCWGSEPAGVDVYRRALGSVCDPEVLVTDEPLPWTGLLPYGDPVVLGEVVDATAVANTAYEYVARAVDAERNPVPGDDDAVLGYASAGEALIGHGTLVAEPDCGISSILWLDACAGACYPRPYVGSLPAEATPYVNSETELRVYGEFNGLSESFCNVHWPRVLVSRVEPGLCTVAVEPVTWGVIKSLYQ